jgi:hypothetical protein
MNIEMINTYQMWAKRGYVTPLTCKNHVFHDLIPFYGPNGIYLICPREDYKRDLGKIDYSIIKRKVEMAEMLWRLR